MTDAVKEELKMALEALAEGYSPRAVEHIKKALSAHVPCDEDFELFAERLRDWYDEVLRHRPNADDGDFLSIEFSGSYHDHEGDGDGVVVASIETKRYETGL